MLILLGVTGVESYRLKEMVMVNLTSSFLAIRLYSQTMFIPMCTPKEKGTRNNNSISGSISQQLPTPTQLCGFLGASFFRLFNNHEAIGIPFPKSHPMRVYCSLWNANDCATQGGLVKTDWTKAPFTAYYRNFHANGCVSGTSGGSCANPGVWQTQQLDAKGRSRLRWVQQHHMLYNYCADVQRFPQGFSEECKHSRL
ncbi:xyloglucan endotransglucosylase hydrolase 2-like [Olea europaea subsp. europaea]|uniref:xyloglucan:xyloglucosyl transferase n=1 Tax=Olea europaea subsp. europaea TaxID=158383 RepID=A0A8S0TLD7_OLEEU|nr:xyloglucan endotransglucosylase hydrolase 2-like [Olea europaea subsp. europaea]